MKKGVLLVFAIILLSCSQQVENKSHIWLVSIGLDYNNSSVNSLVGTVDDALETAFCFKQIYEYKGFDCTVFPMVSKGETPDEESVFYPSAENIEKILSSIRPSKEDVVVFYWSGHGHIDEKGMFLAAAPTEGKPYTEIYIETLLQTVRRYCCPCVLLIDACYSGCAIEDDYYVYSFFDDLPSSVQVISSCKAEEKALVNHLITEDNIPEAHSVFTSYMLKELGWVHSLREKNIFFGYEVFGRLSSVPEKISCSNFAFKLSKEMVDETQNPLFSRTPVSVLLIP